MEKLTTDKLKETIKLAEQHANVYKGCKDGSYDACLAQYNYWAVKAELERRQNEA